jgi:hypothetical protein
MGLGFDVYMGFFQPVYAYTCLLGYPSGIGGGDAQDVPSPASPDGDYF